MNKCGCKTCVHEEVCNGDVSFDYFTSKCDHYKDKSLCVELPCKVGDEVWAVLSIGGIEWTDWYYIGQGKIKGYQITITGDSVAIFSGTVCGKEISFHPVSIKGICKTKQEAENLKQEWMIKEIDGK
jgi:hypothetical protein